MKFTDEQIEYIKNASDHVEMLCGGRGYGKTHQLINEMQDKMNKLQTNWNSLREENKALRLLLNWAEECDWGFDNFRDDDVIDWEEFEEESEDMGYIESMIFYAKKYLDKMNKLEGKK